jgi:hypothetical protein
MTYIPFSNIFYLHCHLLPFNMQIRNLSEERGDGDSAAHATGGAAADGYGLAG